MFLQPDGRALFANACHSAITSDIALENGDEPSH
jgi:hypothetical protein